MSKVSIMEATGRFYYWTKEYADTCSGVHAGEELMGGEGEKRYND